ncbi:DUF2293 domain-containing protein [Coraliomargarita akajimensis]|uniref:DUF2293 domain-containing protein n=1 Tax=Coraliomargarita akajimensis (strain DSM 45221 / IAM 15411 / JCM 23193 / KCTC 12865 / 04OKA010-24) TaxID=583355 RepID=D5EIN6_CORAD|nr:DUF2293 domain-containing protein [Coraliomargarita akajimensis]ADE54285.1 conserved hypothetical protein [Coraliomargarita akajimensis DSM 45221]
MSEDSLTVRPSPKARNVFSLSGELMGVPEGWDLLPPGDAALSRRIKQDGPSWTVKERKGRKEFSRGIWAPAQRIAVLKAALVEERRDPAYQRKLETGRQRRAKQQEQYAGDFEAAVRTYLNFHTRYQLLATRLASLIAEHAVPVGSGTVARTQRIPIEQRAEAAVIAWMRHQTTAYDHMEIPRVKGARREVRRRLAQESKRLLQGYREGTRVDVSRCPLQAAVR